jgi:hypothetical protein
VEELMSCSDADLDDRVRALELERRRVEAELALTAGEIDRRRSYLDDGHRSLQAYLRGTCSYSDAEAARVRRLSAAADGVPGLAEALREGHIGIPQANELAVAHTNVRIRERLVGFAPMLLELAERLSFREFRTCMQRFVMLADLDGAHRDLDESVANRRARVVNLNGSLHLDGGGGDPLVNVELEAILTVYNIFGQEWDSSFNSTAFRQDTEPDAETGRPVGLVYQDDDPSAPYYHEYYGADNSPVLVPIGAATSYWDPRRYEIGFRIEF